MATWIVIGSLLALAGLALYWEWRYRVEGWGRGWMRNAADRPKHARYGWFSSLEDMVWGPPPKVPEPWDEDTIRVSVRWDIDVPLPERSPES